MVFASLGVVVLAGIITCAYLSAPLLLAEPGRPNGWSLLFLTWCVGELLWTGGKAALWAGRGEAGVRHGWIAVSFLVVAAAAGTMAGAALQNGARYDEGAFGAAVLIIAGARVARVLLRRGPTAPAFDGPTRTH